MSDSNPFISIRNNEDLLEHYVIGFLYNQRITEIVNYYCNPFLISKEKVYLKH